MAQEDYDLRSRRGALPFAQQRALDNEVTQFDKKHTTRLKRIIAECGWPSSARYDEITETAAWLIVQHADHDIAFQAEVLATLKQSIIAGQGNPRQFAYLSDRVSVTQTGKQTYGTQLMVTEKGSFLPEEEIGSIDEVNAKRRELGMEPLEDYLKRANATVANAAAR